MMDCWKLRYGSNWAIVTQKHDEMEGVKSYVVVRMEVDMLGEGFGSQSSPPTCSQAASNSMTYFAAPLD